MNWDGEHPVCPRISTYTTFGAVATRVDPKNVTATYTYDSLHRLTKITYSDGVTPQVNFTYDTATNGKGKLASATTGTASPWLTSETYSYDTLGRVTQVSKMVGSLGPFNVGYSYNDADEIAAMTYPSNDVFQRTYDALGRMTQITSPYATLFSAANAGDFNAAGQLNHFAFGNGVNANFTYNAREQLATLRYYTPSAELLNLAYRYSATANNGQIQGIDYYDVNGGARDTARSVAYTYDAWGRLSTAQTADLTSANTWKLQWTYDRLGNRLSQTEPGGTLVTTQPSLSVSTTTNRITTSGYGYDANGSLTADALHTFTYDDDNWVTSVDSGAVAVTYDANGLMVKKVAGGATTVYVYSGEALIAEYDGTGALVQNYVNVTGLPLASLTPNGSTIVYHASDLLSVRVDTDQTGAVVATQGHLPFGETWYATGTPSEFRFGNYIHDSTSNLDFAPWRSYETRLGVFTSKDPLGAAASSAALPSTMGLYGYVGNDPVNMTDAMGLNAQRIGFTINLDPNDPCAFAWYGDGHAECGGNGVPGFFGWGGGLIWWPARGGNGVGGSGGDGGGGGETNGIPNGIHQDWGGILGALLPPGVYCGNLIRCTPIINGVAEEVAAGVACLSDPVCALVAGTVSVAVLGITLYRIDKQLRKERHVPDDVQLCQEEWEDARNYCRELLSQPNPPRRLTGGHSNVEDCARGFVSERCGGNPIDWGN